MTVAAAIGTLSKLGIDTANPVTERFDFQSESLVCAEEFVDGTGLYGTLSRQISRVRAGMRHIQGTIRFTPTPVELALLLPWILGGTPSGTGTVTYPVGEACPTRYVAIDRNAGNLFTYNGVGVVGATFRFSQGALLDLSLDLLGIDETISGSFPNLSIDTTTQPFIQSDLAISINGTVSNAKELTLSIRYPVDTERFFNSQTLNSVVWLDRHVTIETSVPYGQFQALYNTGASGVPVILTTTHGGSVLTQTMANVTFPRNSPNASGRQEIMLPLRGTCYAAGSTKELVTTLNPGP